MKIGIIGKRFSGKTSIFESISNIKDFKENALINGATVKVPDSNIYKLSVIYKPLKTTYAQFDLIDYNRSIDISDSILGSSNLIAKYRELDAILINIGVIDDFSFVEDELNDIVDELFLLDQLILDAKIQRLKKNKHDKKELVFYETLLKDFENKIKPKNLSEQDLKNLATFSFFTLKPWIVSINISENLINEKFSSNKYPTILLSAKVEKEISSIKDEEEKNYFMNDYKIGESLKTRFIEKLYETLNLISFYTVGADEVKAWSIIKGTIAKEAAGKIHSDIERGFIKAEIMAYNDFIKYRDEIKAQGLLKSEGKDYIVKASDIINFKFNV